MQVCCSGFDNSTAFYFVSLIDMQLKVVLRQLCQMEFCDLGCERFQINVSVCVCDDILSEHNMKKLEIFSNICQHMFKGILFGEKV